MSGPSDSLPHHAHSDLKTKLQSIPGKVPGEEAHRKFCSLASTVLFAGLVCFAWLSFSGCGFEVFLLDVRNK